MSYKTNIRNMMLINEIVLQILSKITGPCNISQQIRFTVGLPQMYVYAKYEASIPCSYRETDLSAASKHFFLSEVNHEILVNIR